MLKVNRKKLPLAVLQALSAGAIVGVVAPVANAQVQPAQTTPTTTVSAEDVQKFSTTVTGSRIPSANLTGTSPVTTVGAQDIKLEGVQNVENLLNNLPQVFADFGANESNGATGTATVNLRGLGAQRTLVLINGRRLPAGSPTYYPTDLNQIPAPLIERVEILTGGASAVYGSDAVSGVVNFIMKDNFQGLQIEGNWAGYNINGVSGGKVIGRPTRRSMRCRAMSAPTARRTTSTSQWAATSPATAATPPCSSSTARAVRYRNHNAITARARQATVPTETAWSARARRPASRGVSSMRVPARPT